ncbi:cysteine--tRNA ligase, partial [Patescibacteria group bacterium]|nr:cysteine--tRNA ligase [Patescibacteria group bacterium]
MLKLYNTLSRKKEEFTPLKKGLFKSKEVGLYTCGPTVYNYAHIGNLRSYVFEDILKRTLEYNKYKVKHVMNITDVGHLTSDADEGEDKMEKGAKREGKTAWEIAEFYTQAFKSNLHDLNIEEPNIWCKATDHIPEQIKLVQKLIEKGVTYETSDGIYFDTTKIDDYGKMANLKNQKLKAGERVDMGEKKNTTDFSLWKWSSRHSELHPERPTGSEGSLSSPKRQMEWKAFGRMGFPGWHLECSAMATKYLGEQFDIHCGGIDHIPVHHTNEIAQSETATGKKPWVKYWLHNEFLNMANPSTGAQGKMAKSAGNFITLDTLKTHNINPLAYRYFLLQTHYRKQLSFSWEALEAA